MSRVLNDEIEELREPEVCPEDANEDAALRRKEPEVSAAVQVLRTVQLEGKKAYPPDAMDDVDEFQAKLLGTADDAAPQIPLLRKMLTQITDGVLSARVKIGLLRCFTLSIDRHKSRGRLGEDNQAGLREAQTQMAEAGATQMVAIMVQDTDREVCGRGLWRGLSRPMGRRTAQGVRRRDGVGGGGDVSASENVGGGVLKFCPRRICAMRVFAAGWGDVSC